MMGPEDDMTPCIQCGAPAEREMGLLTVRHRESISHEREEKVPLLGRNYRSDESPELRKVGEIRHYVDRADSLAGGLCHGCLAERRREDGWFRWYRVVPLAAAGAGLILGGSVPMVQMVSLFLLFISLVGLAMGIARAVSHTDEIRLAEAMEGHFLSGRFQDDSETFVSLREFLYRPRREPGTLILLTEKEADQLGEDDRGLYIKG